MSFNLAGGRRLLLAGSQLGWFWIAAGVVAVVLLLVLFREERKLVSRRVGLGLLLLRLTAALVLVAALFEPIAARTYRETVRGRVIVAVDVSESMATADPDRPADDWLRLAKTLKLSPGASPETLSRREVARRLLDGPDAPLGRLAADHAVEAVAFARDSAPATLAALVETLKIPSRPNDPAALVTDWRPALAEALKESAAPVLAVVLVTDGRQNAPGDPDRIADRLAARGVPVYPVLVGSTHPPRDAAVAAVKAPEGVYKGDVASVEATIKLDGVAGQEIAVTLERPGAEPLRQTVQAPTNGGRPVVTFRVPLDEVGTVPLTVAVGPVAGDVRPDNDRRTVSVQVADDQARVLLVDGEARWEFRYVRNALARDPRVAVEAVVFHQPESMSGATEPTYKTALPSLPDPANGLPDPLGAFDAIIVGDVDPIDVSPAVWMRLETYVAERGGTLVVSPGPRFWPGLQGQSEIVRKLLPVRDPVLAASSDPTALDPAHPSLPPGASVLPTTAALTDPTAWPMLQFGADAEESQRTWAGLPRLSWALAGKAKPGASVLAALPSPDEAAVIAAQSYGLGKVLWVGTDGTWRWRYRVGDALHHRFWGQTARWAASGKLTAGNAFVRFGPTRPRVAEGEGATLQARISEGVAGVGPDLLIAGRVFKAGGESTAEAIAIVPLRPVPGQPRTFEATAPPLPLGAYVVRLDAPGLSESLHLEDGAKPLEAPLESTARDTSERVELAAARDPLDRLAAASGGQVVTDSTADTLPPLLKARTRETSRTEETPLWDHPMALLLFFTILTVEWVMRKWVGLP